MFSKETSSKDCPTSNGPKRSWKKTWYSMMHKQPWSTTTNTRRRTPGERGKLGEPGEAPARQALNTYMYLQTKALKQPRGTPKKTRLGTVKDDQRVSTSHGIKQQRHSAALLRMRANRSNEMRRDMKNAFVSARKQKVAVNLFSVTRGGIIWSFFSLLQIDQIIIEA